MEGLDGTNDPYERRTWYANLRERIMCQVAEEDPETPMELQPFSRGQLAEPLLTHVMMDLRAVSLDTPRASDTVAAAYNALRVAHCIIVEAIPAPPAFQARFFIALIDFLDRGLDLLSQPPSADSILADGPPVLVSQTLGVLGGQCLKLSELTVTQWTWVFTVLARAIRFECEHRVEGVGTVCDLSLKAADRLLRTLPPILKQGSLGEPSVSCRDLLEALLMRALDKGGRGPHMAEQALRAAEEVGVLVLHPSVGLLKDLLKRPKEALTRFTNLRDTVKAYPEVALSITEMVLQLVEVEVVFSIRESNSNPPLILVISDGVAQALTTQTAQQQGGSEGASRGWSGERDQRSRQVQLCKRALLTHRALLRALTNIHSKARYKLGEVMAKGLLWPLTEVVRRSDAPSLFYLAFENLNVLLHDGRRLWPEDLFAAQVGKIIGTLFKQYGAPSPALDMGLRMLFDLVPQALSPDMLDPATATPCCEWHPLAPLSDDKACVGLLLTACRYLPRKKPPPAPTSHSASAAASEETASRFPRARVSCFRRLCTLVFARPTPPATRPHPCLDDFLDLLLGMASDHSGIVLRPVLRREMVLQALAILLDNPTPLLLPSVPKLIWSKVIDHFTPPSPSFPTADAPADLSIVLLSIWCGLVDTSEPASLVPPSPLPPPPPPLPLLLGMLTRFQAASPPSPLPFLMLYQASLRSCSPSSSAPGWSDPSLPSSLLPLLPRALSHATPCPSLSPSLLPHLLPMWLSLFDTLLTRDPDHALPFLASLTPPAHPCPALLSTLWTPLVHGFLRSCRSYFNALPFAEEARKHSLALLTPPLDVLALYFRGMHAALAQPPSPPLCVCGTCNDEAKQAGAGMLGLLRLALHEPSSLHPSSARASVLPLLSSPLSLCLSPLPPCPCTSSLRSLSEKASDALLTSLGEDLQPKDIPGVKALLPHLQPLLEALLANKTKTSKDVFWSFWDATFGKVQAEALKPILPGPFLQTVLTAAAQRPTPPPATPKANGERRLSGGGSGKRGSFVLAVSSPPPHSLARAPSLNSAKKMRPTT